MDLTDSVGKFLGISEPSARFLLALFSAYPIALIYRRLVATQAPQVQNLYFTLSGMWVMYYVYGIHIWHSLVDIAVVYLLFVACGGTLLCVTLTWIVTMGHMITGYASVVLSSQVHPISWTIPHCVLVLKLIGLSFNLYDARKKEEDLNEDFKKLLVHKVPSFLEVTGFSYFCGTVLAGPQLTFVRYQAFVNGRLYDSKTTPSRSSEIQHFERSDTIEICSGERFNFYTGLFFLQFGLAGLQRFLVAVLYATLYSVLNRYYPIRYLVTEGYAEEPFVRKLWLLFISGRVAVWRYITVWLFAEASCIFTGISYGETDSEGGVKWDAMSNIHVLKFELAARFSKVVESFNINTNRWIAWYTFKRLRWLNNKTLSYLATFLFVILWHGLWPGYFINFSLEFFDIMASQVFVDYIGTYLGVSLADMDKMHAVVRMPLTLVSYVMTHLLVMYAVICFMLLTWEQCYKFLSAVYFFGHIVLIVWAVFYIVMTKLVHKRRSHLHVD